MSLVTGSVTSYFPTALGQTTPTNSAATTKKGQQTFASAMEQAQQVAAKSDDIKNEFLHYSKMTPAQRIRYLYLKQHGLTEETLRALPAAQRLAIEQDIKNEIQAKLHMKIEKASALTTDVSAA